MLKVLKRMAGVVLAAWVIFVFWQIFQGFWQAQDQRQWREQTGNGASLCKAQPNSCPIVSATDARGLVGKVVTVCGTLVSEEYDVGTWLYLDAPAGQNIRFVAKIAKKDQAGFAMPEAMSVGKRLCVTGQIGTLWRSGGIPSIDVVAPFQLTVP